MDLVPAGLRPHVVTLSNPGAPSPDGDGSYTQTYTALSPATLQVQIAPATARDLERATAGTVISQATHILRGPYHAGVTTETRVTFGARTFSVLGVVNVAERSVSMELFCTEVVV